MSRLCYCGITAIAIGWATIILAIVMNPWFKIDSHALSDLGALAVSNNYIFNGGLILASLFSLAYAGGLIKTLRGKIGSFATGIYTIAAAHLLLIALFPEGTSPHWWISLEFFILTGIAILFSGITLILNGSTKHGIVSIVCSISGFVGSSIVQWPSTALLEVYNLSFITIWIITMLHYHINNHH